MENINIDKTNVLKNLTYQSIEIYADSKVSLFNGDVIKYNFTKLLKVCSVLNIFLDWKTIVYPSPEETLIDYDDEGNEFEFKSEPVEIPEEAKRFYDIVTTSPDAITKEMQEEAIKIFPEAIRVLGVF